MYNAEVPTRAELPSPAQLVRSTIIAIVSAIVILVTIVLPSEYGIDPSGAGRMLGLTEMGEIKKELAEEAEADRKRDRKKITPVKPAQKSNLTSSIFTGLFISSANAAESADDEMEEVSVTIEPGEWIEVKLVMDEGGSVKFSWTAAGGQVKFDLHGESDDEDISYKKGRGSDSDEGTFTAAFDGEHGWYWRNRNSEAVTITLRVSGEYGEVIHYSS